MDVEILTTPNEYHNTTAISKGNRLEEEEEEEEVDIVDDKEKEEEDSAAVVIVPLFDLLFLRRRAVRNSNCRWGRCDGTANLLVRVLRNDPPSRSPSTVTASSGGTAAVIIVVPAFFPRCF